MKNNFGRRLKSARLMRGLSMEQLAAKTQGALTKQAIGKYETGLAQPTSDNAFALAKALDVKVEYFFRPARSFVSLSEPAYRKRRQLSKKRLDAIHEQVRDYVERYLEVLSFFPPESKVPTISSVSKFSVSSLDQVEESAVTLRKNWGLGLAPIDNLTEIVEDQNIFIVQIAGDEAFDGLSCFANDNIPVVVTKRVDQGDRQRFNIAHELGHLLLEPHDLDEEKAANRFAAALMVPRAVVEKELSASRRRLSFAELHALKHKYGMSIAAWIYRAKDLGIISEFYASQWFRELKQYNPKIEPGDPVPVETPHRFERLVFQACEEQIFSESKAAELLVWPVDRLRRTMRGDLLHAVGA
ncbi:helix-turn-helix domain-containing protein [candidate division KSB1 bacterium]|nr:ImmA/IrrE family metallo-endopeptidase [candidate division KSB1 bacterium]RQW02952.1 MAG: helix-turn-helix domain-containing protein [candidate division KSB1 bacterium]